MTGQQNFTWLVVEDEPRMRALLQQLLEDAGWQVVVTSSAEEAQQYFTSSITINGIITDWMLPRMQGVEFCCWLKNHYPHLPVLMLTALGSTDDNVEGLDAGADDYLVKPFEIRELIARLRSLQKRLSIKLNRLTYADLELDLSSKQVKRAGRLIDLTPKECDLLSYLMRHAEQVCSRTDIAAAVWDTHFDTGTNFLDVYINYLRKKVDHPFDNKLIHTRPGLGFVLRSNEDSI